MNDQPDDPADDPATAALLRRARERWSDTPPLVPEDDEVWAPPTEAEQAAMFDGVFAQLEPAPDNVVELPTAGSERTAAPPPTTSPADRATSRWPRRVAGLVATLAAAAAVAWLARSPQIAALPHYDDAGFSGGAAVMRGDEQPRGPLAPDGELTWRLRPATAVTGPVELRLFARPIGAPSRPATTACLDPAAAVRVSDRGAVELRGRVAEVLPLLAGRWSLTAIVGRPEAFASLDDGCVWLSRGQEAPAGITVAGTIEITVAEPG